MTVSIIVLVHHALPDLRRLFETLHRVSGGTRRSRIEAGGSGPVPAGLFGMTLPREEVIRWFDGLPPVTKSNVYRAVGEALLRINDGSFDVIVVANRYCPYERVPLA